ncbi:MAG: DUF378 domain-containing protein [bacterium]|nr:DUF378 domain-containing protein [bacterium]
MKALHIVTFILLVVGGLNWGLVGIADYNLVESLLGAWPAVVSVVYVLVGLSAIVELVTHKKECKACSASGSVGSM